MSDATRDAPATTLAWAEAVIGYWFEQLGEAGWFVKSDAVDAEIRDRFLALHERILAADGELGANTSPEVLAAVIALDQFPRNMFRNSPRAFAADPMGAGWKADS